MPFSGLQTHLVNAMPQKWELPTPARPIVEEVIVMQLMSFQEMGLVKEGIQAKLLFSTADDLGLPFLG